MDAGLLQTVASTTPTAACVLTGQLAEAALATAPTTQPLPHPPPPPRVLPPSPFKPTIFAPAAPWYHSRGAGDSCRPAHSGIAASAADAGLEVPLQPRVSPPCAPRPSSSGEVSDPCASSTASPAPCSTTKAAPPTRLRSLVVGNINGGEVLIEEEGACCGLSREGLEEEDDRLGGWEMVGKKRRPREDTLPLLPRRPGLAPTEGELAFKRRMRGLCFRCLSPCSPRHFARICRGPVRCLTCRRSGHMAKECQDRLAIDIARAAAREAARPKPSPARHTDGRSWAAVAAPPGEHGDRGPLSQMSTNSVSDVPMRKTFIEEQATLMRAELSDLVASKLEEMVAAQLAMKDSVSGLLERFGSFLERAEAALERFSLAPSEVLLAPAPPPTAGVNDGCMDGGLELYGCFSPKETTNSESILALVSECATMQDMPSLQERMGGVDIPSHEEQIMRELVRVNDEGPQERVLPGPVGELSLEHSTLQIDQGDQEAEQQIKKDILSPVQAGSGQLDLWDSCPALGCSPLLDAGTGQQDMEVGAAPCPLSGFLARITVPLAATVLGTPATPLVHEREVEAPSVWRSERLAKLHPKGANIEQLARETVARRLGSLTEEAHPSGRRREDFLALLDVSDRPFSDQEVAAIDDLVLAVNKTKKKKTMSGARMVRQMSPGEA